MPILNETRTKENNKHIGGKAQTDPTLEIWEEPHAYDLAVFDSQIWTLSSKLFSALNASDVNPLLNSLGNHEIIDIIKTAPNTFSVKIQGESVKSINTTTEIDMEENGILFYYIENNWYFADFYQDPHYNNTKIVKKYLKPSLNSTIPATFPSTGECISEDVPVNTVLGYIFRLRMNEIILNSVNQTIYKTFHNSRIIDIILATYDRYNIGSNFFYSLTNAIEFKSLGVWTLLIEGVGYHSISKSGVVMFHEQPSLSFNDIRIYLNDTADPKLYLSFYKYIGPKGLSKIIAETTDVGKIYTPQLDPIKLSDSNDVFKVGVKDEESYTMSDSLLAKDNGKIIINPSKINLNGQLIENSNFQLSGDSVFANTHILLGNNYSDNYMSNNNPVDNYDLGNKIIPSPKDYIFTVTRESENYIINGVVKDSIELEINKTYTFNLDDHTNNLAPFVISDNKNFENNFTGFYVSGPVGYIIDFYMETSPSPQKFTKKIIDEWIDISSASSPFSATNNRRLEFKPQKEGTYYYYNYNTSPETVSLDIYGIIYVKDPSTNMIMRNTNTIRDLNLEYPKMEMEADGKFKLKDSTIFEVKSGKSGIKYYKDKNISNIKFETALPGDFYDPDESYNTITISYSVAFDSLLSYNLNLDYASGETNIPENSIYSFSYPNWPNYLYLQTPPANASYFPDKGSSDLTSELWEQEQYTDFNYVIQRGIYLFDYQKHYFYVTCTSSIATIIKNGFLLLPSPTLTPAPAGTNASSYPSTRGVWIKSQGILNLSSIIGSFTSGKVISKYITITYSYLSGTIPSTGDIHKCVKISMNESNGLFTAGNTIYEEIVLPITPLSDDLYSGDLIMGETTSALGRIVKDAAAGATQLRVIYLKSPTTATFTTGINNAICTRSDVSGPGVPVSITGSPTLYENKIIEATSDYIIVENVCNFTPNNIFSEPIDGTTTTDYSKVISAKYIEKSNDLQGNIVSKSGTTLVIKIPPTETGDFNINDIFNIGTVTGSYTDTGKILSTTGRANAEIYHFDALNSILELTNMKGKFIIDEKIEEYDSVSGTPWTGKTAKIDEGQPESIAYIEDIDDGHDGLVFHANYIIGQFKQDNKLLFYNSTTPGYFPWGDCKFHSILEKIEVEDASSFLVGEDIEGDFYTITVDSEYGRYNPGDIIRGVICYSITITDPVGTINKGDMLYGTSSSAICLIVEISEYSASTLRVSVLPINGDLQTEATKITCSTGTSHSGISVITDPDLDLTLLSDKFKAKIIYVNNSTELVIKLLPGKELPEVTEVTTDLWKSKFISSKNGEDAVGRITKISGKSEDSADPAKRTIIAKDSSGLYVYGDGRIFYEKNKQLDYEEITSSSSLITKKFYSLKTMNTSNLLNKNNLVSNYAIGQVLQNLDKDSKEILIRQISVGIDKEGKPYIEKGLLGKDFSKSALNKYPNSEDLFFYFTRSSMKDSLDLLVKDLYNFSNNGEFGISASHFLHVSEIPDVKVDITAGFINSNTNDNTKITGSIIKNETTFAKISGISNPEYQKIFQNKISISLSTCLVDNYDNYYPSLDIERDLYSETGLINQLKTNCKTEYTIHDNMRIEISPNKTELVNPWGLIRQRPQNYSLYKYTEKEINCPTIADQEIGQGPIKDTRLFSSDYICTDRYHGWIDALGNNQWYLNNSSPGLPIYPNDFPPCKFIVFPYRWANCLRIRMPHDKNSNTIAKFRFNYTMFISTVDPKKRDTYDHHYNSFSEFGSFESGETQLLSPFIPMGWIVPVDFEIIIIIIDLDKDESSMPRESLDHFPITPSKFLHCAHNIKVKKIPSAKTFVPNNISKLVSSIFFAIPEYTYCQQYFIFIQLNIRDNDDLIKELVKFDPLMIAQNELFYPILASAINNLYFSSNNIVGTEGLLLMTPTEGEVPFDPLPGDADPFDPGKLIPEPLPRYQPCCCPDQDTGDETEAFSSYWHEIWDEHIGSIWDVLPGPGRRPVYRVNSISNHSMEWISTSNPDYSDPGSVCEHGLIDIGTLFRIIPEESFYEPFQNGTASEWWETVILNDAWGPMDTSYILQMAPRYTHVELNDGGFPLHSSVPPNIIGGQGFEREIHSKYQRECNLNLEVETLYDSVWHKKEYPIIIEPAFRSSDPKGSFDQGSIYTYNFDMYDFGDWQEQTDNIIDDLREEIADLLRKIGELEDDIENLPLEIQILIINYGFLWLVINF